jgi:hypothetical protein
MKLFEPLCIYFGRDRWNCLNRCASILGRDRWNCLHRCASILGRDRWNCLNRCASILGGTGARVSLLPWAERPGSQLHLAPRLPCPSHFLLRTRRLSGWLQQKCTPGYPTGGSNPAFLKGIVSRDGVSTETISLHCTAVFRIRIGFMRIRIQHFCWIRIRILLVDFKVF